MNTQNYFSLKLGFIFFTIVVLNAYGMNNCEPNPSGIPGIMGDANDATRGFLSTLQHSELLRYQAYPTCHAARCDGSPGDQGACDKSPYYAKVRLPVCNERLPAGLRVGDGIPDYDWMTTRDWVDGNYLWTAIDGQARGPRKHRSDVAGFRPILMLSSTARVNTSNVVLDSKASSGVLLNTLLEGSEIQYSGVAWIVMSRTNSGPHTQIILKTTTTSRPFNFCRYDSGAL